MSEMINDILLTLKVFLFARATFMEIDARIGRQGVREKTDDGHV
jgi:hypothetical protein